MLVHTGCVGFTCPPCPEQGFDRQSPLPLCPAASHAVLLSAGIRPVADDADRSQRISRQASAVLEPPRCPLPRTATPPASGLGAGGVGGCRCSLASDVEQVVGLTASASVPSSPGLTQWEGTCVPAEHTWGRAGEGCRSLEQAAAQLVLWDPTAPQLGTY